MKTWITLSLMIGSLTFTSCSNNPKPILQQPETPKALQDKNESSYELISKKRYDADLVDALYDDLVSKDPQLKDLETRIGNFGDRKKESLVEYQHFDGKNKNYYSSASQHVTSIQDSALRQRINQIIENSESKFNNKVSGLKDLVNRLGKNEVSITDAHIFLKILLTGPVIEKYQNENMPTSKPIVSVIQESESIMKKEALLTGN